MGSGGEATEESDVWGLTGGASSAGAFCPNRYNILKVLFKIIEFHAYLRLKSNKICTTCTYKVD